MYVSSDKTLCETMKREPTLHGLAEKPRVPRVSKRCSRSTMVKSRPNFCAQLVLPLQQHRGRSRDDDHLDAATQHQLLNDETGFHRLAEADIVGDQQIDAWQLQRLGQR